ncbi:nitrite reductase small subunit NirD [Alkalicoccobacillus murimartini]|uniref:Nitrite reductase (NADH) small subunit n=1 Tax=Alkalicoccobacillus murimartini TaxID=171685 RepID=A0ABT9YI50_9BACI|nr:nitrite reductase small subunit NirD [Alkalicoccobacillus murimartini]MDQ0207196.1 nitrite reductase (NADH) small subunit [Alkalicoccobacillus murimartini]
MTQVVNEQHIYVADLNELSVDIGKKLTISSVEIALFRQENGEVLAVENRCPHKGGVLSDGIVSGEHVFCPMHDWKIDLRKGEAVAPDVGCVKTYDVSIIEDKVYLLIS